MANYLFFVFCPLIYSLNFVGSNLSSQFRWSLAESRDSWEQQRELSGVSWDLKVKEVIFAYEIARLSCIFMALTQHVDS